jgi:hypothetical protein
MNPPSRTPLTRRKFLQASAVLAAAAPELARAPIDGLYWRYLTLSEAKTLGVIADIIMPPDGKMTVPAKAATNL